MECFIVSKTYPGFAIGVKNDSTDTNSRVILQNFTESESQKWVIEGELIIHKKSGLCLTAKQANKIHENLTIEEMTGSPEQLWTFYSDSSIRNVKGFCLDICSRSIMHGTQIILWKAKGQVNQVWRIVSVRDNL